jgi:hypothetical protein
VWPVVRRRPSILLLLQHLYLHRQPLLLPLEDKRYVAARAAARRKPVKERSFLFVLDAVHFIAALSAKSKIGRHTKVFAKSNGGLPIGSRF